MSTKLDKLIQLIRNLREEGEVIATGAPTNSLAAGKIAGTEFSGDHPPVRRRKKKSYINSGKGSRKMWLNFLKK
jgi:hypothetical protein